MSVQARIACWMKKNESMPGYKKERNHREGWFSEHVIITEGKILAR